MDVTAGGTTPPATGTVTATLALDGEVATVAGDAGTTERATFEANFMLDVSILLGVAKKQITVNSITAGSTLVEFSAAPSDSGVPVAASAVEQAFSGLVSLSRVGFSTTSPVSGVTTTQDPMMTPPPPPPPPPPPRSTRLIESFAISFNCPNNCYGGGICNRQTGRCQCFEGRFRDDCKYSFCPGEFAECSGAGECDYMTGECHCIPARAGADCGKPDVDCPNDCTDTTHGTCDRLTGVCTCSSWFMGEDCSRTISPCGDICPGRSFCNGLIGECECPAVQIRGRTYENVLTYGYGCNISPCPMALDINVTGDRAIGAVSSISRETSCNNATGNGVCDTYTGECVCEMGYLGLECERRECVHTINGAGQTVYCSGHGFCNFTSGQCACNKNFDRADCSRLLCPDSLEPSGFGDSCGGDVHPHAHCDHSDGTCYCDPGYIGGGRVFCDMKLCPGVIGTNACSGRANGRCNYASGKCVCKEGRVGETCQLKTCPGEGPYPPLSWTETEAAVRSKYRTAEPHRDDVCGGHGECDPTTGVCSCDEGYSRGVDIETRGIVSEPAASEVTCSYRLCPNGCSGNGVCDFSTGICDCYLEPYTNAPLPQPACEMTVCPLGPISGLPCDQKGDCNFGTGECTCTTLGSSGPACSQMVCLNDCWGQGECNRLTGVCYCEEGWEGMDCGTRNMCVGVACPRGLKCRKSDGECVSTAFCGAGGCVNG